MRQKSVTFVSLQICRFVLVRSLVHDSITSVLLSRIFNFVKSSVVATCLDCPSSVFPSCARNYLQIPSSTFLSTKPNATFNFCCTFETVKHKIKLSNTNFVITVTIGKLKTLCLPISISLSTKKCLHVSSSSLSLLSWMSHISCVTSTFWAPGWLYAPCSFGFCSRSCSRLFSVLR